MITSMFFPAEDGLIAHSFARVPRHRFRQVQEQQIAVLDGQGRCG